MRLKLIRFFPSPDSIFTLSSIDDNDDKVNEDDDNFDDVDDCLQNDDDKLDCGRSQEKNQIELLRSS